MHGTEHESETFIKYIVLLATPFDSPAFVHKPCMPKTAPQRCYSSIFFQKDRTPIVATKRCTLWCVILMGKVGGNLLQTVDRTCKRWMERNVGNVGGSGSFGLHLNSLRLHLHEATGEFF